MAGPRHVTLKLATSLDGRIATASGESRWITGAAARESVHRLRAQHDAVLIGAETALADDPDLTVRLADHAGPQPARVVLDSRQRLSPQSRLAQTARQVPTYLIAVGAADPVLTDLGVRVLTVPAVGLICRASIFSSVDLPEPLCPTSADICPTRNSTSSGCTSVRPSKCAWRSF